MATPRKRPKDKLPSGAPTKWYPDLNERLVAHFSGEYFREVETTHIDKKTGKEWTTYEQKANAVPTLQRFAADNGLDSDNFSLWAAEPECESKRPGFIGAYKRAKQLQHDWVIACSMTGFFNPAFAIFFAKNNMGMRDRFENEHSGPNGGPIQVEKVTFAVDQEPEGE